jgi:hypothetical protein
MKLAVHFFIIMIVSRPTVHKKSILNDFYFHSFLLQNLASVRFHFIHSSICGYKMYEVVDNYSYIWQDIDPRRLTAHHFV